MFLKYGDYEHKAGEVVINPRLSVARHTGEVHFETWTITGLVWKEGKRKGRPSRPKSLGNHRGRYYRRLNAK